ncbi:FkbM family methyltransferase [uncultured Winogradskyella sp.]|uniref:FkbM family methyltransferase n=1 Tax=uncultured Winogradskyella sp. TaxID=395353 RepID=UPI002634A45A|nr:FkbM family methyltransferase [uncultured Winogradskyella sp.]
MNNLLVKIYDTIPKDLRLKIGKSKWLKGFRRYLLYDSKGFKTAKVVVNRVYGNYKVNFQFVASIKMASKAKRLGTENTVLRNSFFLIEQYKSNRNNLTVLDVGSNFGYLGAVWADSIAKNGKVLAFEPNKNLFASITKTIEANVHFKRNFKVYNLAVGAENETITINASNFSSNAQSMDTAIETYDVEMVTLESFLNTENIQQVDLIKIDVDGIELDILKGAINLLKQNNSIVIVETNDDMRIVEFFKELDYRIYDMKLNVFDTHEALPLNIFCVPKNLENHAV